MKSIIAVIENYKFSNDPRELGIAGLAATARNIEEVGFDWILTAETRGQDPFFPLLIAAEHTKRIGLFTGIAVAFPRVPMVTAQMAWDLQRLSDGRFHLGLGTQVKGHNERRYSVPWNVPPGPRMREYVQCLQAIFKTFQDNEHPTFFEGKYYRYTMAPPVLTGLPIAHPHVPIVLGTVSPYLAQLSGELCDGIFPHPVCTAKYLRERILPAVEAGARKAGRALPDFDIVGSPIIVTYKNAKEKEREWELLKRRVSFYASTRTYHRVFKVHGWKDIGMRLHALSLEGKWEEMVKLIPDEMAEEFGTIGYIDEIGPMLKERWGGLVNTMNFPTDFPLATKEDERHMADIINLLHSVKGPALAGPTG